MPDKLLGTKYAAVNQLEKISDREQVRQPKNLMTQKCSNKSYMVVLGQRELTIRVVLLAL